MTAVYLVYDWDSMASSAGAEYLEGVYVTRKEAEAKAKTLNDAARAYWMTHCSPAGAANYTDNARVVERPIKRNEDKPVEHVCGLQGYQRGREYDPICPACKRTGS